MTSTTKNQKRSKKSKNSWPKNRMSTTIPTAEILDEDNIVNDGLENIELGDQNKQPSVKTSLPSQDVTAASQQNSAFSNFGAYALSFGGCVVFTVLFFFALNFYLGELSMKKYCYLIFL